jgi:hypothetical protein
MKDRIVSGILVALWAAAASAHEPADPNRKAEPLTTATVINLNGFLCTNVVSSKQLKTDHHIHEVVCVTGSGNAKSTYIYNEKTGKVTARQ